MTRRPVQYRTTADSLRPYSADFRAGFWAGLIAGFVDEVILTVLALAQGGSAWAGIKATAAMALGAGALQAPDGFQPGIFVAAMVVHFALSVLFGIIGAALMRGAPAAIALLIGLLFGLAIYTVDFYVVAPLYFEWFVPMRGMAATIATHAVFGLVLSAAYIALRQHFERRSGFERRVVQGQVEPGRRRLVDRRRDALAYA